MVTVTHAFHVNIADNPTAATAGEVLPSHWNANHVVTGIRTILTGNMNFYVSATGSDSNGGTNSSTDAWLTLQHAMNVISSTLDFAGFTVTVNIGAGSFVGLGVKSCTGGGILLFLGAGSGSTTITGGPNDGLFNLGECFGVNVHVETIISINAVKFAQPTQNIAVGIAANYVSVFIGNITGGQFNASDTDIIFTQDVGVTNTGPGISMVGICFCDILGGTITTDRTTAATFTQEWAVTEQSFLQLELLTVNIVGNPNYRVAFANCVDAGIIYNDFNSVTFVGSATGRRFRIRSQSLIDSGNQGLNWLPGDTAGIGDPSSHYCIAANAGSDVPITVADLLANFSASDFYGSRMFATDLTTAVTYGSTVVGGGSTKLPVYSDGSVWRQG